MCDSASAYDQYAESCCRVLRVDDNSPIGVSGV